MLDAARIGLPVSVFVAVETADHSADWLGRFAKVIAETPEIVDAWRMSGDVDYLLHVVVPDIAERVEDSNTMAVLFALGVESIQGRFVQKSEAVVLG